MSTKRVIVMAVVAAMVAGGGTALAAMTAELILDAGNITGLTNGETVATWTDSSGFGRNATTAVGAATYQTNVLNGKPVVRFDEDAFTVNFTTGVTQPVTFFVVAEIQGNNANAAHSTDYLFDSDTGTSRIIGGLSLGGSGGKLGIHAGSTVESSTDLDWQGGFKIYEFYFDGASSFVYLDGSLLFSGSPGSNGITAADGLQIGSRYNQAQYLNGDIAEFHVYSGMPTLSERNRIGGELELKYGLSTAYEPPAPVGTQVTIH